MDAPEKARALRRRCQTLHRTWWAIHYLIGLLGILSAALLTALTSTSVPASAAGGLVDLVTVRPNAWLLGVTATVCGSLVTLLGPIQKAERYWSAFHMLDQAIMELESDLVGMFEFAQRVSAARRVLQISDTPTTPNGNGETTSQTPTDVPVASSSGD